MKKIFFLLFSGMICFLISCSDTSKDTTVSSTTQKNIEASRKVSEAFGKGDPSGIDSVVAADFVDHTDRGDMGRDSLKAMITMVKKEFPDMKMEVINELADEDYVFTLMRFTGTSNGQMGMPKGPYDMQAIQVVRLKDGKIVEHWEYMEPREMMKMMPQMDHSPKKDTATKKSTY